MDTYLKTIIVVMLCAVFCLSIPKQSKEIAVTIAITACCMAASIAFSLLDPVFTFVDQLADTGNLDSSMLKTLLKAAGICLISEFSSTVCEESGQPSLGKVIHFLSGAVLLSISIPYLNQLIELVSKLLTKM